MAMVVPVSIAPTDQPAYSTLETDSRDPCHHLTFKAWIPIHIFAFLIAVIDGRQAWA